MKNLFTILSLISVTSMVTAQVGINQDEPAATLDVVAKTDNNSTTVEGVLVPRVSKQKAYNMATTDLVESTLIYINDMTYNSGTQTKVEEITAKDFYHWDADQAKWVRHKHEAGEGEWRHKPSDTNPYIYAIRAKEDGGKDIVATESGRFGVGTKTPDATLEVEGNARIGRFKSAEEYEELLDIKYTNTTPSKSLIGIRSEIKGNSTISLNSANFSMDLNKDKQTSFLSGVQSYIFQRAGARVNTTTKGLSSHIELREDTWNYYTYGVGSQLETYDGAFIDQLMALGSFAYIDRGGADIGRLTLVDVKGALHDNTIVRSDYKGVAIRLNTESSGYTGSGVEKAYGLYINAVDMAEDDPNRQTNFAIYTQAGEVSLGDDVVVRDEHGIILEEHVTNVKQETDSCTEPGKIIYSGDTFLGCKAVDINGNTELMWVSLTNF